MGQQGFRGFPSFLILLSGLIACGVFASSAQSAVVLLPHQQGPVQHLLERSDKKGLLINHSLGSGKTLLAIALAEAFPDKEPVVIAPSFLKHHWLDQMAQFPVKDAGRYKMIDLVAAPALLQGVDLRNKIVVLDESHRLIEKVTSATMSTSAEFGRLYRQVQKDAFKVLALSGTPIYNAPVDLAYQINLVSGHDGLPINSQEFKKKHMIINAETSFLRGHVLDSNWLPFVLTGMAGFYATHAEWNYASSLLMQLGVGVLTPMWLREAFNPKQMSFRSFHPHSLNLIAEYTSYYDQQQSSDKSLYPAKTLHQRSVDYTEPQYQMLLDLFDGSLSAAHLVRFSRDEIGLPPADQLVLNSERIQASLRMQRGAGRQIGNIAFKSKPSKTEPAKVIEPAKFVEINKTIAARRGGVVIYSHYYHNGLKLLSAYLQREQPKLVMAELSPGDDQQVQRSMIERYNAGKIDVLFIHPDITEGISLKGTDQLHILEPPHNAAALDQIIGRVVRYRSHMHLPLERRQVDIYLWQCRIPYLDSFFKLRQQWWDYYREFSYYSPSKAQYDPNVLAKSVSPDEISAMESAAIAVDFLELKRVLQEGSIESLYQNKRGQPRATPKPKQGGSQ